MKKYKHTTPHNGRFTFQLLILGHPCRTSAHYDSAEEAALGADLVKFYLASTFKYVMSYSLDGEQFSCLAFSRRGVNLNDNSSVLKSLPEDVRDFILKHRDELQVYADAQPEETVFSKISRHAPSMTNPAIREWVSACEAAAQDEKAFSALNQTYIFSLLDAASNRLTDVLKPLKLALKLHGSADNPKLFSRRQNIAVLIVHFEQNLEYVKDLTANLRAEEASVKRAVANLEATRPALL